MKHYPLIRTIYLYLFALVGLGLLIVGGVRFVDMGLKAFVFTKSDEQQRLLTTQLPIPILGKQPLERAEEILETEKLTQEEKAAIEEWLVQYEDWQERVSKIDRVTSKRHEDASLNLSLILLGLPLYLYHWRLIRKETKNKTS